MCAPAISWIKQELGLRERKGSTVRDILRGQVVFHGYSARLLPKGLGLPEGHRCVGYWWPAPEPGWQPDKRHVDFLECGSTPVFFGFGSVSLGNEEHLTEVIRHVSRKLRVRSVVQAGWQGLQVEGDDILTITECPHDWLFPHMAALTHHAGPGTMAAGLRAGVPTVPVPLSLDQPFWAHHLTTRGLAPAHIPARKLTAEGLAHALRTAVNDHQLRERCAAFAQIIRWEDGAAAVLNQLESLVERQTSRLRR